jgi:hypothetical protein
LQIVVTDYAVGVTPAVVTLAPGSKSRHLVTVVAQGGAFGSEVALSCATASLPPQTTCEFDPPTVVPGAAGGRSTLTVATAASAAAASAARAQPAPRLGTRAVGSGIAVFPASLTFGTQIVSTSAPPQLVHATNIGIDVLALSSITVTGDFSAVHTCGISLAVGASCSVEVSFTPTAAGSRTGTLTFVDDAPGAPHAVTLNGSGQAAPDAAGGTPAGNYTVTVMGTSGTLSHVARVILTVQ